MSDDDAVERDPIEVLVEEYFEKRRRGESSDPEEFARRIPGCEADFRSLVAALDVLESSGGAPGPAGAPAAVPERLGRFRLLRRIGRGGMGTVYEAIDDELGRRVALKVLPGCATLDARELARFRREAQSAARLSHPHIVPVYGVGEEGGTHWIAMQLIEGPTLADGTAGLPPREVARHGLALAEALAYAHAEGVVHRDVKPSNVLLDRSGVAWIADFGLATSAGAADLTRTGETIGTPRYMAPEAFSGWADPRADVWGVGVTLYELLARRPAFDGVDRAQLMKQICDVEPRPLRDVDPALPRDLATVVHHCLQKEPGARYASARELADDLRRFLDGAPIRARPPSLADRAASLLRRHRAGSAAAAVGVIAVVTLLIAWAATLRGKNDRLAQEIARSDENLAVASDAIASVLDEATANVVFRVPALDPMRQRVLEAALAFELRLLARQETSAAKRFDVAMAHLHVGAIDWELRRLDESRAHYEAAALALRGLAGAPERTGMEAAPLSAALAGIACVARERGEYAAAEASLRDGLAVLDAAIGNAPPDSDAALHLVDSAMLLADVQSRAGRAGEAAAQLEATLARATPALERDDARAPARRALRSALVQLAEAQNAAGATAAAAASLERALAVSRRLVGDADPDVRDLADDAVQRSWLGALQIELGSGDDAPTLLARARDDLEAIALRWPMVPEFRCDLAVALTRQAAAHAAPDGEPKLLRAIEIADGCLAERPDEADFAWAALHARNVLATWRDDGGDLAGAHAVALAATERVEALRSAPAHWPERLREQAAVAWYDRGTTARGLGRADESRAALARAAALAEGPLARTLRLRIGQASGSLSAETGAPEAALAAWADVEEAARRLLATLEPGDRHAAEVVALLIQTLNLDANTRALLADRPDRDGAAARLNEALALAQAWVAREPRRADGVAALGMVHGDLGRLAYLGGDPARARDEFRLALPLLQRAIELAPRGGDARRALAITLEWLAGSLAPPADAAGLAELGALVEVAAAAAAVAPADADVQVGAARVFARAAAVKHGKAATLFGAPAREPWADAAMERLLAASAAGFGDAARMERDVAFAALEGRADYRRWLAGLKAARR